MPKKGNGMKVGIVTARSGNSDAGGAERFYEALISAFRQGGHDATELSVVADEPNFDQIKRNYLACYDLDVSDFDLVVSTKAPTWLVRHPRHVCYLVHTIRVFYDMFDTAFPEASSELHAQRKLIHDLDTAAFAAPRCKAVFSIGNEVSKRLRDWNGIKAEVLHPPLWTDRFRPGEPEDYLLLPGRLHAWKRVDLVIRAMRHVEAPLRLVITGTGEAEGGLRALAADDPRIEFRGRVSDTELVDLYAAAFAVPFTPVREDYGYVTLEAFASGKPVVTCSDSGEAAAIVSQADGGLVCAPDPPSIAHSVEKLWQNRALAIRLGNQGLRWVNDLSWPKIVEKLVAASSGE
jgi:glycosyltransferase involved in cell wall biosynthesis